MKTPFALLATGLALSWPAAAQNTLNDARTAVRKGTTEGIVLIPARKLPDAPPAAASAAAATGGTTASAPAAGTAPKSSVLGGLLDNIRLMNPPSGQSLQAAKRDDAAGRGIALPSAASAAKPASAPR